MLKQNAEKGNQKTGVRFLLGFVIFLCLFSTSYLFDTASAASGFPVRRTRMLRRTRGQSLDIQYTVTGSCKTGDSITVTANASGGNGDYTYAFSIDGDDPYAEDYTYSLFIVDEDHKSSVNSWTIPIYSPGTYYVVIEAWDSDGLTGMHYIDFDQPIVVTGEDLVRKKTRELAQRFLAVPGDDYDKVLAAHDWLVSNAAYDYNYQWHSPYGVLMEGTGVCESYARAFQMIMQDMNIPSYYVIGDTTQGLHAWNVTQINGKWYNIDCTWDDFRNSYHHLYFCLNDELFFIDHSPDSDYVSLPSCNSLEDCYCIRSGFIEEWIEEIRWDINNAIFDNEKIVEIPYDYVKLDDGNRWGLDEGNAICAGLLLRKLNAEPWNYEYEYYEPSIEDNVTERRTYSITASYNASNQILHINVNGLLSGLLSDAAIQFENEEIHYAGIPVEALFTVVYQGQILQKDIDYMVSYENNTAVGLATVTVSGLGGYMGQLSSEFTILPGNMEEAEVVLTEGPYVFSGEEIKPLSEVMMSGNTLDGDADYSVVYENNLHAGTAKMTVTGNGNMQGTIEREFVIEPADIQTFFSPSLEDPPPIISESIFLSGDQTVPSSVTIVAGSRKMTADDYVMHYQENLETGEAVTFITGKNDFTGTWVLKRNQLGQIPLSCVSSSYIYIEDVYNGKTHDFENPVLKRYVAKNINGVKDTYYTLVRDKDFTVSVAGDLVNVGEVIVTYQGIGRFTGERVFRHRIVPRSIANHSIELKQANYIYSGAEKKPEIGLEIEYSEDGKIITMVGTVYKPFVIYYPHAPMIKLVAEKDFIAHYSNNVSPGTATVTVEGIGNFTGTTTAEFQILPGGQDVCRIPAGVTELEQEAFSGTNFSEFILPDAPVTVADRCFSGLQKQTAQITIPHAASSISENAFEGIENLTIIAPESLTITMGSKSLSVEDFCKVKGYYYEKLEK